MDNKKDINDYKSFVGTIHNFSLPEDQNCRDLLDKYDVTDIYVKLQHSSGLDYNTIKTWVGRCKPTLTTAEETRCAEYELTGLELIPEANNLDDTYESTFFAEEQHYYTVAGVILNHGEIALGDLCPKCKHFSVVYVYKSKIKLHYYNGGLQHLSHFIVLFE